MYKCRRASTSLFDIYNLTLFVPTEKRANFTQKTKYNGAPGESVLKSELLLKNTSLLDEPQQKKQAYGHQTTTGFEDCADGDLILRPNSNRCWFRFRSIASSIKSGNLKIRLNVEHR